MARKQMCAPGWNRTNTLGRTDQCIRPKRHAVSLNEVNMY